MKFAPQAKQPKEPAKYRFQIQHFAIDDAELSNRARVAAVKFGLKHSAFVLECVKFALDHMD
jgi:hypothetical protein